MAKLLTITCIPPSDAAANMRLDLAKTFKISTMGVDGKVNAGDFRMVGKYETQRLFKDQSAVDEWIDFLKEVEKRYGGQITKIEVKDVD